MVDSWFLDMKRRMVVDTGGVEGPTLIGSWIELLKPLVGIDFVFFCRLAKSFGVYCSCFDTILSCMTDHMAKAYKVYLCKFQTISKWANILIELIIRLGHSSPNHKKKYKKYNII